VRVVIVGGGVVGNSLAQQLLYEKHTISLVEPDPKVADEIAARMDLQVVVATGSSPAALEAAGIADADMVIAVTPIDEVNLLVCNIAQQYGVRQRIARLRSREFISADRKVSLEDIGVTAFIFPEKVVVDAIRQYIETPGASDAVNFENGNILLRGYKVRAGMPIVGKSLVEIRAMIAPEMLLIAAVERGGKGMIPPGDFVVREGDEVFSLFPRRAIPSFMNLIDESHSVKRVILTGNNISTVELAMAIEDHISSVICVDPDLKHAEETATQLKKAQVIHGDCTEVELLNELNVDKAEFFIASSNEADYNMLSALLAKTEGAGEVIAVSTEYRHDRLFHSIGIDHVINPRITAAREIMQIISRGHIGSVVQLGDAEIDALRLIVPEDSEVVGVPLKDLWKKLRKGALIGILIRGDAMIIPDGETVMQPGDHVITIAYTGFLPQIRRLFKVRG
jgi:trk system potassium uptake protein TrkA